MQVERLFERELAGTDNAWITGLDTRHVTSSFLVDVTIFLTGGSEWHDSKFALH